MTAHPPVVTLPAGYLLRRLRVADTATTARLHRRLLPNGLFPRLGPRFLRHWHGTFLDTPAATGLAVVHHGEVVAFLLASVDQRLYLRHTLRRHRRSLMWWGALGLLARPHVLVRFVRTRLRSYARHLLPPALRPSAPDAPASPPPGRGERRVRVSVVHAVVTSEQARGLGCARALLDTAVDAAVRARADHVALVTDVEDPSAGAPSTGAAAMYERLGWQREAVRRHRDGRWVAEYRLPLPAATAGGAGAAGATGAPGGTGASAEGPA